MNIKAVIFDADGVLVQSELLSDRLLVSGVGDEERFEAFFRGVFQDCLIGKADLRTEVEKVMSEWRWSGTVDELLAYWFSEEANKVDHRFESVVSALKSREIVCALGTNNEKYRTHDLIHNKGLGKWFARHLHFSSSNVGHKKPEPEYFVKVTRLLGLKPHEIAFWDDDKKNVEGALLHGWQANHYTDFGELQDWVKELS